MGKKNADDKYNNEEVARRRDEVIRRMANTPPQPRVKGSERLHRVRLTAKRAVSTIRPTDRLEVRARRVGVGAAHSNPTRCFLS